MISSGQIKGARAPWPFFALVFVLSIPLWVMGAVTGAQLLPGLPVSALQAFCPVLAAAILVYRHEDRRSVAAFLSRAVDFRRVPAPGWFALAVFLPALPFAAGLALVIAQGKSPSGIAPPLTLALMCVAFIVPALAEELGWSGYALEPLEARLGAWPASLLIGAVWAVWHFVPLVEAGRNVEWIAWWALATVAMRVVMVWLYVNAGRSVFAVALFHAASNFAAFGAPLYYDPRMSGIVFAALAFLVSTVPLALAHRPRGL